MLKVYLAGPDVFRNNPNQHFEILKKSALEFGIEALCPFDSGLQKASSIAIFQANLAIIQKVDMVIANLEPFRGLCVDDGTAFEIGYAFSLKKMIYGYSASCNYTLEQQAAKHPELITSEYPQIEDFNHPCNLMILHAITETKGKIFPDYLQTIQYISRIRQL